MYAGRYGRDFKVYGTQKYTVTIEREDEYDGDFEADIDEAAGKIKCSDIDIEIDGYIAMVYVSARSVYEHYEPTWGYYGGDPGGDFIESDTNEDELEEAFEHLGMVSVEIGEFESDCPDDEAA